MSWDQKLKRLQENLGTSAEGLAGTLGITTRTLSDFMKPEEQGGRTPTGPVQKLIELLLGEIDSQGVVRKPTLNLVIIHGDFRVSGLQDPVEAILTMHAEGGRNNEFHYVTVAPERDARWAIEGLTRKRIQPHFFAFEQGMDTQAARDCYFTATAMWLASQAMRRDLAHITLAADMKKFWPLARELRELAGVDVTVVREAGADQDPAVEAMVQSCGVSIADPIGRKFGWVTGLRGDIPNSVTFGFVQPATLGANHQLVADGPPLFFSYNHMRKDRRTNLREFEISQLVVGDVVSFAVGMNYKGPCAIDVALVDRPEGAPVLSSAVIGVASPRRTRFESVELVDVVKDAVTVCADDEGWALLSNVGNRISVVQPDFKERLRATGQFKTLTALISAYPDEFEESDGQGTRYTAKCIRLRAATRK